MTAPMDKINLVADWTARNSLSPCHDTTALARRKLPAAPGNSSPESTADDLNDPVKLVKRDLSNYKMDSTSNARPFDRYRNLSIKKMGTTGNKQASVEKDLTRQHNVLERDTKQNYVSRPNWRTSSNNNSSGSAPNSARSGSSESSGYHSKQDVARLSTKRKPMSSSSLSIAHSRSN